MSKLSRSQASRNNGAKSHGPVTPEGRARSAQNAQTHGIFKSPCVLRNEANPAFLQLEAELQQEWRPLGPTENALLDQMLVCTWRLRRIWQAETAGIDLQMDEDSIEIAQKYKVIDEPCRGAIAFKHLADQSNFLDLLQRYDRSLSRQFDRALARLKEMQKDRGGYDRNANLQNEPKPAATEPVLQNEPKPAPESANLQNEPGIAAARPEFPNQLVPGRGQLIEISQGGEVIALLRPKFDS